MSDNRFGDVDMTPEEEVAFQSMLKGPVEEPAPEASQPAPEAEAAPAAEAKDAPAPEAEDDAGDEPAADPKGRQRNEKGQFVPHKALHAEREEHKKTKSALEQERINNARYSERLAMLLEAIGPVPQEAPSQAQAQPAQKREAFKPVNPEEDLIGALKQIQEVLPRVDEVHMTVEELRAQRARDAEMQQTAQLSQRYAGDVQKARSADPHFDDAVRHLVMQQDAMLQAQGWTDPQARRAEIEKAERNFVMKAYRENANPAQRLFDMAKAMGWKAPEAAPANNGAQPSAAASKIDKIAQMQKAAPSLSNVATSGGDGMPTLQQIMAMGEEDYAAFVRKIGGERAFEKRYLGRN